MSGAVRAGALALLLCAASSSAAVPGPAASVEFSGFLTPWRQSCAGSCGLPSGEGPGAAVSFALAVPDAPGQVSVAKAERSFVLPSSGETLTAVVTAYFVCPRDARPVPGEPCPSRYVQVQVALDGAAAAFCGASLNPADAWPFPVMMCAGQPPSRPGERLGVSLSRRSVSPAFAR